MNHGAVSYKHGAVLYKHEVVLCKLDAGPLQTEALAMNQSRPRREGDPIQHFLLNIIAIIDDSRLKWRVPGLMRVETGLGAR